VVIISDEKPTRARSGNGVRFTLTVGESPEVSQSVRGWRAFRNEAGAIDLIPPGIRLRSMRAGLPGKIYELAGATPAVIEAAKASLEATHGHLILGDDEWNRDRAGRRKAILKGDAV
jgi:hypothetical protein